MPWVCEFCGWENLQDDRVGRKEPACLRCGRRRGEMAASIEELQQTIERCRKADRAYTAKLRHLDCQVDELRAELSRIVDEHDVVVREQHDNHFELSEAVGRLTALQAIRPGRRQVAEGQRTLPEVR